MGIAIGTFISLHTYRFQNFFQAQTITWDGDRTTPLLASATAAAASTSKAATSMLN